MTASANAQARIGHLAELYTREGRERTPEESQTNTLADQYGWDVDMLSRLLAEKENTMTCPKCGAPLR